MDSDLAKNAAGKTAMVTAQLVRRTLGAAGEPLPARILVLAKQCVLDWVGVALAGAHEPVALMLREQAFQDGGKPVSSAVAGAAKFSPRQAALINGAAGHALDYDDANIAAQGHMTAAVLPAALSIAQAQGLGGERLLRAFAAGYECAGMVGQYVGRAHYDHGFHGTGTVGSFGAALASAVLLGLDAPGAARAIGIAGTQAAGLKAQFGTMCKPLHAGKAAENGVVAAQLAARGFSSRDDLLEAPQGFGAATSPHCSAERALATPPGGHYLFSNLFKYHAACYGTHSAIDAVSALRRQYGFSPEQVRRVELRVEPAADGMCNIAAPRSGLEAKFSLRFNAALALAGADTASPLTYADSNASRADLCALRDVVTVRLMPKFWPNMMAEATIELTDGRVLESTANSALPCADLVLQGERLLHKFRLVAAPVLGAARAEAVAGAIGQLDTLEDVGVLMSMLE